MGFFYPDAVPRSIVAGLQTLERRLSEERGPFRLFALFMCYEEERGTAWRVVACAEWWTEHPAWFESYLREELGTVLSRDERFEIAGVVAVKPDDPELEELAEEHPVEHGKIIVHHRDFGRYLVRKGYIITCRPPGPKAAEPPGQPEKKKKKKAPRSRTQVIHRDPEILGGTPVFVGTRVPLKNLIDYLEGGHSLNEFLADFPSVTREQAIAVLEEAKEALIQRARAA